MFQQIIVPSFLIVVGVLTAFSSRRFVERVASRHAIQINDYPRSVLAVRIMHVLVGLGFIFFGLLLLMKGR
jgi:hypothetical protein